MSKWMKVDPATLKVGDEARWADEISDGRMIREGGVREVGPRSIRLGLTYIAPGNGTWYVRKPKKAKPPTRPDEPPVGSFFRVDRTGGKFLAIEPNGDYRYLVLNRATDDWPSDTRPWDEITEPGDTIKMLELREVEK